MYLYHIFPSILLLPDTQVESLTQLLWIVLQLCGMLTWRPSSKYPGVVQLGHMVGTLLVFLETHMLISIVAGLVYIPTRSIYKCSPLVLIFTRGCYLFPQ